MTFPLLLPAKYEKLMQEELSQYKTYGEWFACDYQTICNAFEKITQNTVHPPKHFASTEQAVSELMIKPEYYPINKVA
jgi:hypothetical protein